MHLAQAKPLCHHCLTLPALAGQNYCCEACKTLHELSSHTQVQGLNETQPEDQLVTQHFAQPVGDEYVYECSVESVACEACSWQLASLKNKIEGLSDLRWDRHHGTLQISFKKNQARPHQLSQLLSRMGLNPRWQAPGYQGRSTPDRTALIRVALSGALFGNMMLFSVPIYSGVAGAYATLFFWIQGLLFLPIVTWCALPFYRTSLLSLRLKKLSTDLPLTIAFSSASLISYYALLKPEPDWIYFDSLSGFIFLIILSRYLLERSLKKTESTHDLNFYLEKAFFEKQVDLNTYQLTHWKDLKPGDILKIQKGQRLPSEGVLVSDKCELDSSWVTGEFWPAIYLKGARLTSGSLTLDSNCKYQITELPENSSFAKIIHSLKASAHPLNTGIESKIGAGLISASFVLALILFLFFSHLGTSEILHRVLALWIVACPCAISFAGPLARASGSNLASKLGFWIRDIGVFESLHKSRKLAFDKTGTLTTSFVHLNLNLPILDDHIKKIILSLENISDHPIAKALRESLGPLELLPVTQGKEVIGEGVEGYINGHFYEIKKSSQQDKRNIELKKNGVTLLTLNFEESLHPHLYSLFTQNFKPYESYILSGDNSSRVKTVGQALGLPTEHVFGDLSPIDKNQKLKQINPDVYIGDGTNDALALQSAKISISMGNASLEAQQASQIVMTHSKLEWLPKLFKLSFEVKKVLNRNLWIALSYNLGAGAAAILGIVGPLEAAVLMPLASFSLLLATKMETPWMRQLRRGLK